MSIATRRARRHIAFALAVGGWLATDPAQAAPISPPEVAATPARNAKAAAKDTAPLRLTFAELAACPLSMPAPNETRETWRRTLSAPIRAAQDQRVVLTGYMLPTATGSTRARQFLLMRNQNACCFGQMPAANEYVIVESPAPGVAITMDVPVTITGRLQVAPLSVGGTLVQFYTLSDAALANGNAP